MRRLALSTPVGVSSNHTSSVPLNLQFYVDDLEAEWTYAHPFDFIYMRMLSASIQDWPGLFKQAYECVYLASDIVLEKTQRLTQDSVT